MSEHMTPVMYTDYSGYSTCIEGGFVFADTYSCGDLNDMSSGSTGGKTTNTGSLLLGNGFQGIITLLFGTSGSTITGNGIPTSGSRTQETKGYFSDDIGLLQLAQSVLIAKIIQNKDENYWSASLSKYGPVLGTTLEYEQAVAEVMAGRNVFARTKFHAEKVARAASSSTNPYFSTQHKLLPNYWDHFHATDEYGKQDNTKGHVWYLF